MSNIEVTERKIKHLNTLKRTVADLTRRIEALEKEVSREMCSAYHEVNNANAN